MPTRQKKAPPLQTKEEIAKEQKLTTTCAMGMKMTLASNECWKNQVKGEERITNEWRKTFQPDFEEQEAAAIERILEKEAVKREERETNPLRPLLLDGTSKEGKGRKLYLSERLKLAPQEKQSAAITTNQTIGWDSQRFAGSADSPLATQRHLYHNSKGRGAPVNGAAGKSGMGPQSLQNSSSIAGSMGTVASAANATASKRGGGGGGDGYDLLEGIQSISYDGKSGACDIVKS